MKDIKGYEGVYKIDEFGNVLSCSTGLVRKASKSSNRYLYLPLCKNGKKKYKRIHRLVAETFIPNPDNLPQVNHKDEDIYNNHVSNLEWCTQKHNLNHGSRNIRISKSRTNNPKISRAVQQIKDGVIVRTYPSIQDACRDGVFKKANIHAVCNGKRNQHGGYNWKYKE